ncbi:MAG: S49 family peptidase [Burkholderiaceae bacterium]|nr:MAG: S49 family peptidase [Burkholderiaceae bacterium]
MFKLKSLFGKSAQTAQQEPSSPPSTAAGSPVEWERQILENIAFAALKEQRAARRWKVFFRLILFFYVGIIVAAVAGWSPFRAGETVMEPSKHTSLVSLEGVIEAKGDASAEKIMTALQAAFEDKGTQGVILRINSPGGSPVQASMINDEIYRLRAEAKARGRDIKVYVVVEEMCASGGYYVAAAADEIFVNQASLVGSIGVLMDSFGVTGLMEKMGIERRLLTAGENKGMLDPFSPLNPQHQAYVKGMLNEVHQQFIAVVKKGRGGRLKETPDMFSGLFWTGAKSVELGLADGFGTVESVARDVIKAEKIVEFTQEESLFERFARRFGTSIMHGAMGTMNSTAVHWR